MKKNKPFSYWNDNPERVSQKLNALIEEKIIKHEGICRIIGLKRWTIYERMKDSNWSRSEVRALYNSNILTITLP